MNAREAIDQAKEKLVDDRNLTFVLNSTGTVRVPVMPLTATHHVSGEPDSDCTSKYTVVFTIEDCYFGKRLFAEFNGHKEFAA